MLLHKSFFDTLFNPISLHDIHIKYCYWIQGNEEIRGKKQRFNARLEAILIQYFLYAFNLGNKEQKRIVSKEKPEAIYMFLHIYLVVKSNRDH